MGSKAVRANPELSYRLFGVRQVEGWLEPYSADFISSLAAVQRRRRWRGAVGEIGVHHGKLFILLRLNAAEGESSFAVDVFQNQHLNTDRSGSGDQDIFLRNIARWCGGTEGIKIIAKSSLATAPEEITAAVGAVRLASIDGGHTEECTLNDLRLVERILANYGVAIVDDYFNQHWPGVSAGVAKYLIGKTSALQPFAISPNKVYFTRPNYVAVYRQELNAAEERSFEKESMFFGYGVDIYGCNPPTRTIMWHLKDIAKNSSFGPYVLAAKASVRNRRRLHD